MSGWTDLPLSELGRRQVRRLVAGLRGAPRFDAIYASPLVRARETAAALADAGLGTVTTWPGLEEIHCGELEGQPIEEVARRNRELWDANLRQDDDDFRWPGGESYRELRARALAAIDAIAARHPGGSVAIVTHAGVITQIVGHLCGVRPARWEAFRPENTALTIVEWSGHVGRLVAFDRHDHLAAAAS